MGIDPVGGEAEAHAARQIQVEPAPSSNKISRVGQMSAGYGLPQSAQKHAKPRRHVDAGSLVNQSEAWARE